MTDKKHLFTAGYIDPQESYEKQYFTNTHEYLKRGERSFNCFLCGNDLLWQSDFDYEDMGREGNGVSSIFTCTNKDCNLDEVRTSINH